MKKNNKEEKELNKCNCTEECDCGCQEGKECVLRLGHASGWRFITGAWTENLDNFKSEIVPASRPKNFNYEQYVFPKSRRLDEDGDIFGFVKLELL